MTRALLGTLTTLFSNDFAPPRPGPTAHMHINTTYPSFPTKPAYYKKIVSPPSLCKYL